MLVKLEMKISLVSILKILVTVSQTLYEAGQFTQGAMSIILWFIYRISCNKRPRRLLNFEIELRRYLERGAYVNVREINNIKCQKPSTCQKPNTSSYTLYYKVVCPKYFCNL